MTLLLFETEISKNISLVFTELFRDRNVTSRGGIISL